ncbi:hypothetical protein ACRAWD_06410 [Caulobacter segnis]
MTLGPRPEARWIVEQAYRKHRKAQVDEFYPLQRLTVGPGGRCGRMHGRPVRIRVAEVYPRVTAGRVTVDLAFVGDPAGRPQARRGRSDLHACPWGVRAWRSGPKRPPGAAGFSATRAGRGRSSCRPTAGGPCAGPRDDQAPATPNRSKVLSGSLAPGDRIVAAGAQDLRRPRSTGSRNEG